MPSGRSGIRGLTVDEITIADELKAAGRQGYIAFMAGIEHFTAANAGYYADKLREAARLRALEPVLRDGLARNKRPASPRGKSSTKSSADFPGLFASPRRPRTYPPPAFSLAYLRELEHRALENTGGRSKEIDTGLPGLDSVLGPIRPGEVVIIAARPGVGKTALALGMAAHVAVDLGKPGGRVLA